MFGLLSTLVIGCAVDALAGYLHQLAITRGGGYAKLGPVEIDVFAWLDSIYRPDHSRSESFFVWLYLTAFAASVVVLGKLPVNWTIMHQLMACQIYLMAMLVFSVAFAGLMLLPWEVGSGIMQRADDAPTPLVIGVRTACAAAWGLGGAWFWMRWRRRV